MPNEHSASNKKSTHCKHKKLLKTWKEGINYNTANTKGGTDGQTWRRLKRISSGRDDRIGAKIKTQKNPPKKFHAEFPSHKILFAELCNRDTWELLRIFRMFWITQKNPIFQPKKIPKSKTSNHPKNPLITPVPWNPEYTSPPALSPLAVFHCYAIKYYQNQNCSIGKLQNLGNERSYLYKDSC